MHPEMAALFLPLDTVPLARMAGDGTPVAFNSTHPKGIGPAEGGILHLRGQFSFSYSLWTRALALQLPCLVCNASGIQTRTRSPLSRIDGCGVLPGVALLVQSALLRQLVQPSSSKPRVVAGCPCLSMN